MNNVPTNEWISRSWWHITQVHKVIAVKDKDGKIIQITGKQCDWCNKYKKR